MLLFVHAKNEAKWQCTGGDENQWNRLPAVKAGKMPAPLELHDKQSERDTRELRIDKVGVRGLRFPIQVRDKAHSTQNTIATIGMFVDLPKEFKGTHMSRFVEVLNAHGSIIHVENIREILMSLQKRLNSATSHIEVEFPYFMSKRSPVSRGESLMDYVRGSTRRRAAMKLISS